jgi:perosamine synthetase
MPHSSSLQFSDQIGRFFGGGSCFLFAKGRVGLYAGLRAMELTPGRKILMPGYTCLVVPSAVQYAGLTPAYVDIDPETYNLNPALLDVAAPSDTAALIVQHTYGIPCDMASITAWTSSRTLPIIEDNCHTFGTRFDGRLCGTFGRFAFMSGQWNKPFSTGLGGMLLVNEPALAAAVERLLDRELKQPSRHVNTVLRCQIKAHDLLVRPATALLLTTVYRALNRLGLVKGSSSSEELRGVMPADYFTAMAPCQVRRGLKELARIEDNIRHRTALTAFYQKELPGIGLAPLRGDKMGSLPLLRYPVRVANKREVLSRAARRGVEIGSWFEVPLHPEGTRMEDFGYREGMCPEGEKACREVVNLPTHRKVTPAAAQRTLDFLKTWARPQT